MSALVFFEGEVVRCDGCGDMHNDIVQCECGIVRCPGCREEGCRGCDREPEWVKRWRP